MKVCLNPQLLACWRALHKPYFRINFLSLAHKILAFYLPIQIFRFFEMSSFILVWKKVKNIFVIIVPAH